MKRHFLIAVIILIASFIWQFKAQSSWESIGPHGGYIRCLVKDNQGRILAGTVFGGIFRTSDAGENWEQIFMGNRNEDVRKLAVNPGGHIFAGTDGYGLYRSTDGGASWERLNNLIYTQTVISILVTQAGDIFAGTFNGLYRSTDNGATFSSSGIGISGSTIRALGFSNGYLFAGSDFNGVFRSSNNGANWEAVNSGIDFSSRLIEDIASTDYGDNPAANIYVSAGDKLYKSDNLGINWDDLPIPQRNISDLLIRSNGNIVASASSNVTTAGGGIIESTDQGNNWLIHNLPNVPFSSVEEDNNGNMVGGSHGPGTYVTTNGVDWNIEVTGMPAVEVTNGNAAGGVITISTRHSGSFVSEDEGVNWEKVSEELPYGWHYDFKVNPVTNVAYILHQNGTYKTTYGDWNNWVNTNIFANAIGFNSLGHTFLFSGSTAYRSTDGSNFQANYIGNISYTRQVAFDAADNIYIATANESGNNGSGVWRATINGDDWQAINNNLPLNIMSVEYMDISGFGQLNCQREIVAGSSDGKFFAMNEDFSWNEFNLGFTSNTLVKDIAALNYSTGIKTSVISETELAELTEAGCDANQREIPEDIYASFYSTYLRFPDVANSTVLEFLGTNGSGIFKRELSTDVEQEVKYVPIDFRLEQNYPNPFNPSTTIQFSIPEQSFVKLEVFNTLGEKVATLVSEELNAGNYKYEWKAEGLPSGIYFYKLSANSFGRTGKMVLLK